MDAVLGFYLSNKASVSRRNVYSEGRGVFLFFRPWGPSQEYYLKGQRVV